MNKWKRCHISYCHERWEKKKKDSECPAPATIWTSKAACKRTQHCWMSHVASVGTPCCMLRVVGSCCAKFETGQTFSPVQTDSTLLDVTCCVLLGVVAQSLKPAHANGRNIVSQHVQLPTFLGFVASVCLSLTFQKENRRANLRLTEKLLLGLKYHNSLEAQS